MSKLLESDTDNPWEKIERNSKTIYVLTRDCVFKLSEEWSCYEINRGKIKIDSGFLTLKEGFEWNGLTLHQDPDHLMLASAAHDAVLPEISSDAELVRELSVIPRKLKDRLFLDVALSLNPRRKYPGIYVRYAAIRAWSITQGVKKWFF